MRRKCGGLWSLKAAFIKSGHAWCPDFYLSVRIRFNLAITSLIRIHDGFLRLRM